MHDSPSGAARAEPRERWARVFRPRRELETVASSPVRRAARRRRAAAPRQELHEDFERILRTTGSLAQIRGVDYLYRARQRPASRGLLGAPKAARVPGPVHGAETLAQRRILYGNDCLRLTGFRRRRRAFESDLRNRQASARFPLPMGSVDSHALR
ncbi:hypothetical protein Q5P01_000250 [Channa striata]|uniref:Uncharacterized protein n=1 Tax=Channa striata TaxID=64152 RepID=A0AA88LEA7_CHASR|nr:hypothetical protein Q5P01_000250 [Channa striata]